MRKLSAWLRRLFAQLTRKPRFNRVEFLPDWPERWRPDTVYLQGEDDDAWFAAFVCPCGCEDVVYLNLLPDSRPRWAVQRGDHGRPTITPSVSRVVRCRSHFWVKGGRVRFV